MSSAIPPNHVLFTSCEPLPYLVVPIGKFCQFNFAGHRKRGSIGKGVRTR